MNSLRDSIYCIIVFLKKLSRLLQEKKVVFIRAFDFDFGFSLRERRSPTLDQIQTDALEIESNLSLVGKIKPKESM